jgi:Fe-S cluster assembly protein SufD
MTDATAANAKIVNAEPTTDKPPEGVTETLNRARVEAWTAPEPQWLKDRRLHSWEVYEATPMPTTRLEEWRYTNLKKLLHLESFQWPELVECEDDFGACPDGLQAAMRADHAASGHIWEIDGIVFHEDLEDELRKKGVVLTSLRKAIDSHADLLKELLATEAVPPETGKMEALNSALWTDGILLHVPAGVRLDLPVRVTRWVSQEGVALFSRTLIVAEAGSQVSFVDEVLSEDMEEQTLVSNAVEVRRPGSVRLPPTAGTRGILPVLPADPGSEGLHAGHPQCEHGRVRFPGGPECAASRPGGQLGHAGALFR